MDAGVLVMVSISGQLDACPHSLLHFATNSVTKNKLNNVEYYIVHQCFCFQNYTEHCLDTLVQKRFFMTIEINNFGVTEPTFRVK